ncbi:hypothetical protein K443DRAFT_632374 [Laccaria amethystina LaAM-08-1]|uniref:NADP-dependent oxidoreductase domain-containing protein n=1 Tax=Laccaria amethystina LaAM-08-1 TaxID=1095629 RepID=A0A0C9XHW1_9AGAR|nr:hypothetical protein K443DRAFT_632374 [Laccaria amethystina LaAM-08-1]
MSATKALTKIPLRQLGRNGPHVANLGFGCMGIGAFYGQSSACEEMILKTLTYTADRGMTFWDTADIYGTSEAALRKWFASTKRRKDIFLATKFSAFDPAGPPEKGMISQPSYVRRAFLHSLSQLKTDYVDLYYQHRVDTKVPIEIVLEALREFVESGQIKYLGLSECSVETLKRAKNVKGLGDKIIAVQMEYSPFTLEIELPSPEGQKSFAQEAEALGVSIVAYSPLACGLVTGRYVSSYAICGKRTFFRQSLATERIEENTHGGEVELSAEAIREIRKLVDKAEVAGTQNRTLSWITTAVEGNCLPLDQWKGEN